MLVIHGLELLLLGVKVTMLKPLFHHGLLIPPEEEANAVSRVLLSNKVSCWTGTECREFEKEFSKWVEY